MNHIKEVHTKEITMTIDNITEAVTQKQSMEKCLKSTEHIRRGIPSECQEAITLKSHVPIGFLPGTHCTSQDHPP